MELKDILFLLITFSALLSAVQPEPTAQLVCQTTSDVENLNYDQLMGKWYSVYEIGDKLSKSCGSVEYSNYKNGVGFKISFNDTNTLTAIISPNNRKTNVDINGSIYYHTVVSTDYDGFSIIYLCPTDREHDPELFWVLSRSPMANHLKDGELQRAIHRLKLQPNRPVCKYLEIGENEGPSDGTSSSSGTTTNSTETTTTSTETATTSTETATTSTETATTSTETATTSTETATTSPETSSTTETPTTSTITPTTSTEPPTTTGQTPSTPDDFPQGFKIPGSDKTFYFLAQFPPKQT